MACAWIGDLWPRHHLGCTIRRCLIHLAVILSSCHPANCAFLLWVLPSVLKGQQLVSFFVTPITWQLNSQFPSHYLEAEVYLLVYGAVQVSKEGHADPSTKGTHCPVLKNRSRPSVTFHGTLLPVCEKQTQRTGTKILLPRQFAQSAHMLSGEESWPLLTGELGTLWRSVSQSDRRCIVRGSSQCGKRQWHLDLPWGKNIFHNGPEERSVWVLSDNRVRRSMFWVSWKLNPDLDSPVETEKKK